MVDFSLGEPVLPELWGVNELGRWRVVLVILVFESE
jgi:hypothetical protein